MEKTIAISSEIHTCDQQGLTASISRCFWK